MVKQEQTQKKQKNSKNEETIIGRKITVWMFLVRFHSRRLGYGYKRETESHLLVDQKYYHKDQLYLSKYW